MVAVSPSLSQPKARVLGVRQATGSVRVTLLNRAGRPVPGTVLLGKNFDPMPFAASRTNSGRVTLRGLHAGTYILHGYPGPDRASAPIGQTMLVRLRNGSGMPLRNCSVQLQRPPGPLTDAFWPKFPVTDALGELRPKGLEMGEHHFKLQNKKVLTLSVPAAPANEAPKMVDLTAGRG